MLVLLILIRLIKWSTAMQAKLMTTFDRLSEPDFLAKSGRIVTHLTDNSHYPKSWVVQIATLAKLTTAYTAYLEWVAQGDTHNLLARLASVQAYWVRLLGIVSASVEHELNRKT